MTVYKSPWARSYRRTRIIRHCFVVVLPTVTAFLVMSFLCWVLIECASKEAAIAERQRIYRMVKAHDNNMALYIKEMEQAGKGGK